MQTKTVQTKLPPSLKPDLFGGHVMSFRRRPIDFLTRMAKLGDISYFKIGSQDAFFINHPDLVRDVFVVNHHKFHKGIGLQKMKLLLGDGLLTSENELHLRQRRLVQPAFHRQRIAGYAASMIEFGERAANSWDSGATYDVSDEMMRLTLYIVSKTLFNADVESETEEISESVNKMLAAFNLMLMPFFGLLQKLPIPQITRYRLAQERINEIIYRIINERRQSGEDAGDLLSILLLAQDEETGIGMSDKQVRDEVLTLFLAGHETTANALTWTWYLLSQNPEAESKFHEEIDRVLENKRLPGFEDYAALKYTEAVFAESMRLFPPAWVVGRTAVENHELAGYKFGKDALVFASPYTMHRNERFYDDAEKFKPERWLHKDRIKEASQNFTYFPFGGGVRRCVGEQFAWTEGVLLLATIARKWQLKLVPNHKIELKPLVTLRPKYGMKMTAIRRNENGN
ncbi:MAG: cytochrome P450 [Pyrinomonadaceae bacterium]